MLAVIIKGIKKAIGAGKMPIKRATMLGNTANQMAERYPKKITAKKRTALTIGPVTACTPISGAKRAVKNSVTVSAALAVTTFSWTIDFMRMIFC